MGPAALKQQPEAEIKEHNAARAEAEESLSKATAPAFASESGKLKSNIDAPMRAIAALDKGNVGSFLQTRMASVLWQLSLTMDMNSFDRDTLVSFLSQGSGAEYAPQNGEIIGTLQQMMDEMAS